MSAGVSVWRIGADTPDYEAHDLSGKGAEKTGGRWNRKGTAVVYASVTRALACLETVVHVGGGGALPLNRYLVRIAIPEEQWLSRDVLEPAGHVGWDAEPAAKVSMDWGTRWQAAKGQLLAEVPSVIVPEECTILINPSHADVSKLTARKVRKWLYDPRLV